MYFGFIEISVCKEISELLTLHVPLIEKTINLVVKIWISEHFF